MPNPEQSGDGKPRVRRRWIAGLPEKAEKLGCPEMVAQLFCFSRLYEKEII
jgi:hypothetical protein